MPCYHSFSQRQEMMEWLCNEWITSRYSDPVDLLTNRVRSEIYNEYCRIHRYRFSDDEFTKVFAFVWTNRICQKQSGIGDR